MSFMTTLVTLTIRGNFFYNGQRCFKSRALYTELVIKYSIKIRAGTIFSQKLQFNCVEIFSVFCFAKNETDKTYVLE